MGEFFNYTDYVYWWTITFFYYFIFYCVYHDEIVAGTMKLAEINVMIFSYIHINILVLELQSFGRNFERKSSKFLKTNQL